jgi:aquaporin NIP
MPDLRRRMGAEFIGTFFLVFIGVGSVATDVLWGVPGAVGISLAFGAAVATMIYAVGHLSGAHFNPAVTVAFAGIGRFPVSEVPAYIAAQLLGGTVAALVLDVTVGLGAGAGTTVPAIPIGGAFVLEVVLTFSLMFVITSVATDARAAGGLAGVAIGLVVAMCALMGGPFTGASMNPARSFAPALATSVWSAHWVYWTAPFVGAVLGAMSYEMVRGTEPRPAVERAHDPGPASSQAPARPSPGGVETAPPLGEVQS